MKNLGDRRLVDFFLWPKNMLSWMAQYFISTKERARGRMPSGVVGGRRTMSMSTGVLWGLPHPHMVVLVEWAEELSIKRQIGPMMRDRLKKLMFYKKNTKRKHAHCSGSPFGVSGASCLHVMSYTAVNTERSSCGNNFRCLTPNTYGRSNMMQAVIDNDSSMLNVRDAIK